MKILKSGAIILLLLFVSNALVFAQTILGTVKQINAELKEITVYEETSHKTYVLPISADTKPLGLDIFKNLIEGFTVSADVTMSDDGGTVKTVNSLEVIGQGLIL